MLFSGIDAQQKRCTHRNVGGSLPLFCLSVPVGSLLQKMVQKMAYCRVLSCALSGLQSVEGWDVHSFAHMARERIKRDETKSFP